MMDSATPITIALLGNPNSGKTTLLNALTGAKQRVGNWPGVTVERKSGYFKYENSTVEVVDLPGVYSLISTSETIAIDERIACEYIFSMQADIILNIIDASNIERHLYVTSQLLDLQIPTIIVLNMADVAQAQNKQFNISELEKKLGCPVIPIVATKKQGIEKLKKAIVEMKQMPYLPIADVNWPSILVEQIEQLTLEIKKLLPELSVNPRCIAIRLLENDYYALHVTKQQLTDKVVLAQKKIQQECEDADILLADTRYGFAHDLTQKITIETATEKRRNLTQLIDQVVLNRFLGIPLFLLIMYGMFLIAIGIGGALQDFFDIVSQAIFVDGFSHLLQQWHVSTWLITILADGAGKGLNTTITFIPVIAAMFFCLSFLEASGYMARAAFVVDRVMAALGLPGKAFVPMVVGFGCNVPAIMGARILEHHRDRILAVMMMPFMSCSARLAIYAVFTAAFFPVGGQNIVFLLYILGILIAILTGLMLRKTLLPGEAAPFIMELPTYHMPTFITLWRQTWERLKGFLFKAGKVIVPVCTLIGILNSISIEGHIAQTGVANESLLSHIGHWLTPLFAPMGIQQNNWPATVGLLTGTMAKEVVIATLNTLYMQIAHLQQNTAVVFNFGVAIKMAFHSILNNLSELSHILSNPFFVSGSKRTMLDKNVYGLMMERFDNKITVFAYLLFTLLYIPCVSTAAVMMRELNKIWMMLSILWSMILAYAVAVSFYQMATLKLHPWSSLSWIFLMILLIASFVTTLSFYGRQNKNLVLPAKVILH